MSFPGAIYVRKIYKVVWDLYVITELVKKTTNRTDRHHVVSAGKNRNAEICKASEPTNR